MAVTALADEVHRVISTAVDGTFYRAVNRDLADVEIDPVRHYAESGWREARDPAPWFSTSAYLKANPDVAKAGWNPLHHYLTHGRREGREVMRSVWADDYLMSRARRGVEAAWSFESLSGEHAATDEPSDEEAAKQSERSMVAAEFDADFYFDANPDVAATATDPLGHFLSSGWLEGSRSQQLVLGAGLPGDLPGYRGRRAQSLRPLPQRRPRRGPDRPQRAGVPL
jgi:chorismate-pyruvate lyase